MRLALGLAAVLLLAACGRKPEAGGDKAMALYEGPDKRFTCETPAAWRVKEEGGMVSFYGPPEGPAAYAARVSIRFFPKGSAASTPQAYALAQAASGAKVSPLKETSWKGSRAYEFQAERTLKGRHGKVREQKRLERAVLIPASGGFYAVVHSAAPEARDATAPVLDAVLASFQPK